MTGVLLTGATGLVGSRLIPLLEKQGHRVRSLSRRASDSPERLQWDGVTPPNGAFDDIGAVIHLAGEPIFGKLPTAGQRKRILESRVASTRGFVEALTRLPEAERPELFLCASAVGYYGERGDAALSEGEEAGSTFSADVCKAWEAEALRAESIGMRTVRLRIGVVLAREGGALAMMRVPFQLGLGGPLGSGEQWMSWIHADDLCRVISEVVEDTRYRGAINAVAHPVRNRELTEELAHQLKRPAFMRVPKFALRAALGPLASELLGSRRVVPTQLEALGFEHAYPELRAALAAELS